MVCVYVKEKTRAYLYTLKLSVPALFATALGVCMNALQWAVMHDLCALLNSSG